MLVTRHSPDRVVGGSPLWREGMETAKDLRNILRWMCRENEPAKDLMRKSQMDVQMNQEYQILQYLAEEYSRYKKLSNYSDL